VQVRGLAYHHEDYDEMEPKSEMDIFKDFLLNELEQQQPEICYEMAPHHELEQQQPKICDEMAPHHELEQQQPEICVFVKNVPDRMDWADLKHIFLDCGVTHVKVLGHHANRYGVVKFRTFDEAKAAVEWVDGYYPDEWSKEPLNVYIDKKICLILEGTAGPIWKGPVRVHFDEKLGAAVLDPGEPSTKYEGDASATLQEVSTAQSKKLFVGGIATAVTEEEFKSHFQADGEVSDAVVMVDRESQRSLGFGFVTFVEEVRHLFRQK
jgi:hypothetical protein